MTRALLCLAVAACSHQPRTTADDDSTPPRPEPPGQDVTLEVTPMGGSVHMIEGRDADPATVGTDPCVPLLGRETEVTESSAGCDTGSDPQLPQALIARRRWEQMPECVP